MSSDAMCFEIVLPRPPLRLPIRTCNADEAFQSTFGRSFAMSSRLVMTITVVFSREADIFGDTFGVTALERLCVFAFMLTLDSQRQ
jgi:hypothetical protein